MLEHGRKAAIQEADFSRLGSAIEQTPRWRLIRMPWAHLRRGLAEANALAS